MIIKYVDGDYLLYKVLKLIGQDYIKIPTPLDCAIPYEGDTDTYLYKKLRSCHGLWMRSYNDTLLIPDIAILKDKVANQDFLRYIHKILCSKLNIMSQEFTYDLDELVAEIKERGNII